MPPPQTPVSFQLPDDFFSWPLTVSGQFRHRPAGAPVRDGFTFMITASPGRIIVLVQPSATSAAGLLSSTVYVRPLNGPSATAMYTWLCGLVHANSRTLPTMRIDSSASYVAAALWCAAATETTASDMTPNRNPVRVALARYFGAAAILTGFSALGSVGNSVCPAGYLLTLSTNDSTSAYCSGVSVPGAFDGMS